MAIPKGLEQILDLARWAPSGDNTQPWRFEVVDEWNLVVHGFDTREHCVYDLDGHPSQISIGALLETMAIAASQHGLRADIRRRPGTPDTHLLFDVRFAPDTALAADPLVASIEKRSVQRRAMRTLPLTHELKQALEHALGSGWRLLWLEGLQQRLRAALLMFGYAKLRLTMPEAYRVHRDIIEWNARFSAERVPDQALGIDRLTLHLMRFVMGSWTRVSFFNRFLAGTWMPRLQMDLLPGLACAAHFVLLAEREPSAIDDYVAAGRATQRFWLALTNAGLVMQPEMTPLIFSRYARGQVRYSDDDRAVERGRGLAQRLEALIGDENARLAVFMGRLGHGAPAQARSVRREVRDLLVQ